MMTNIVLEASVYSGSVDESASFHLFHETHNSRHTYLLRAVPEKFFRRNITLTEVDLCCRVNTVIGYL